MDNNVIKNVPAFDSDKLVPGAMIQVIGNKGNWEGFKENALVLKVYSFTFEYHYIDNGRGVWGDITIKEILDGSVTVNYISKGLS